jgi:hypothetical protein
MASRGGFFLAWPGLAGRPPSPKAAAAAAAFRISTAPRPARECEITCFCPLSRAPQLLSRPRVCSHATPPGRRPLRSMAGLPCQCVSPRRPAVSCLGSGWPTSEQTTTPTQVAAVGCAHPHHTCPFAAAPRCGARSSTNFLCTSRLDMYAVRDRSLCFPLLAPVPFRDSRSRCRGLPSVLCY